MGDYTYFNTLVSISLKNSKNWEFGIYSKNWEFGTYSKNLKFGTYSKIGKYVVEYLNEKQSAKNVALCLAMTLPNC